MARCGLFSYILKHTSECNKIKTILYNEREKIDQIRHFSWLFTKFAYYKRLIVQMWVTTKLPTEEKTLFSLNFEKAPKLRQHPCVLSSSYSFLRFIWVQCNEFPSSIILCTLTGSIIYLFFGRPQLPFLMNGLMV